MFDAVTEPELPLNWAFQLPVIETPLGSPIVTRQLVVFAGAEYGSGPTRDWAALDSFLLDYLTAPEERATAIASSFAASLELVREGHLEMRQEQAFAALYMRSRPKPAGVKLTEVTGD